MKNYLFKIATGIILLCSFAPVCKADTQTNIAPQITVDGSKLSGSWRKPEDLIAKSDAVFSGQLLTLVKGDFAGTGTLSYGAKVKILQQLKGMVNPEINVLLYVFHGGSISEEKPQLNHTYIFFAKITKEDNLIQITKLMDGTDDRIAKVKQLIIQVPK